MPRPSLDQLTPRRIVLIKPSALGDVVHSLGVLSSLRRRFPTSHIAWVVNRAYEPILAGHPDLNETIAFDRGAGRKGVFGGISALWAFAKELRSRKFDLAIDLQGLLRSGLLTYATGAPRRVGLSSAREGGRFFYTDVVREPGRLVGHAVDRYMSVARAFGDTSPMRVTLPVDAVAAQWAAKTLEDLPRPWMAFGVGSRWLTKRWLPEHFATLARRAQAEYGGSVVFVGTPDEAELSQRVQRSLSGPSLELTGRTTLAQLTAVLAKADVMVANDTGPLHMAVALGRPVVAPYTCTRADLTGPYGQRARAVETDVWCKGSLRRKCSRMECMADLTPERLMPHLGEILASWRVALRVG